MSNWTHDPGVTRCGWVPPSDELYCRYHDTEWGRPVYDDKLLFRKLILDGMQAGLSWITILRKRENILQAFDNLDPDVVAFYGEGKIAELLQNAGIIRSKAKINAAIHNAQLFRQMRDEEGVNFSDYLWSYVGGSPKVNRIKALAEVPAKTEISEALAKDLRKRGFKFCGPVIVYAFMQAVGMVNDHTLDCHVYEDCAAASDL